MTTGAEMYIELDRVGGPHGLDTRDYISIPVFVHFGDGRVVWLVLS